MKTILVIGNIQDIKKLLPLYYSDAKYSYWLTM